MNVKFTPRAIRDLAQYIAKDNPIASLRVAAEVEKSAVMLAAQPDADRHTSRRGVRLIPIPRLPYLLFDRQNSGGLEILTVRDGRRRLLG